MKKSFLFFSTIFVASFAFGFGYEEAKEIKKEEYFVESVTKIEESQSIESKYYSIEKVTVEINTKLPSINDYMNESIDGTIKYYKDDIEIDEKDVIKNIGEYVVNIYIDNEDYTSKLIVQDTIKPELKLKDITIYKGVTYNANSFVKECTDNSNVKCAITFKDSKMENYKNTGSYDIVIVAKDYSGNEVQSKAKLIIKDKQTDTFNKKKITSNNSNKTSNNSNTTSNNTKIKTSNSAKVKTSNINASTTKFKEDANKLISVNKVDANKILELTNKYRKEKNVKELKLDNKLCQAANVRAMELAFYDYFEHTRPNGDSYWTVLNDLNIYRKTSGENIAFGYETAEEVSQAWKDSEGHYKNMINSNYTSIGIGEYSLNGRTYYVQIFISK